MSAVAHKGQKRALDFPSAGMTGGCEPTNRDTVELKSFVRATCTPDHRDISPVPKAIFNFFQEGNYCLYGFKMELQPLISL